MYFHTININHIISLHLNNLNILVVYLYTISGHISK